MKASAIVDKYQRNSKVKMTAKDLINKYISFFEKKGHKRIPNAPLVPENDPTTLFTSAGMQPLIPYLLGEAHPQGKRLVNVQNCFRAADIDEVGDNRHTTFFRMLGNWSLGDYFKKEEIHFLWEFLTKELGLDPQRLYISVFEGYKEIPRDEESKKIWEVVLRDSGINPEGRIFYRGVGENWWSKSGPPDKMPEGEIGGPDTEVHFDLNPKKGELKDLNDSTRLLEIANSVFMQYQKIKDGSFRELPQKNVDFGGGLERLLAAVENKSDIFETSLFQPIIQSIEVATYAEGKYKKLAKEIRIIADHLVACVFIASNGIVSSNKEQGYILRRLIRRAFDNINRIRGIENMMVPTRRIVEAIVNQYKETDPKLATDFEKIVNTIFEETNNYRFSLKRAQDFIKNKYNIGDELKGETKITADDAFNLYTSHGLSPSQIKSLGFLFDDLEFAEKMKKHRDLSRAGAKKKFYRKQEKG